jgi:hypothetical protein
MKPMLFDRLKAGMVALIREVTARYDYAGLHGYSVEAQNGDGTLELTPDDPDFDPPLSSISIQYDTPAMTVTVSKGARCTVAYINKDPSRPVCFGFLPGAYEQLTIGEHARKLSRVGDLTLSGGVGSMLLLTPLPGNVSPAVTIGTPYLVSFGTATFPPLPATPVLQGRLPGRILTGANRNLG